MVLTTEEAMSLVETVVAVTMLRVEVIADHSRRVEKMYLLAEPP